MCAGHGDGHPEGPLGQRSSTCDPQVGVNKSDLSRKRRRIQGYSVKM